MRGIDFPDEGGLDPLGVPELELQQLQGHRGVDEYLPAEITEIDYFLRHSTLLIVIQPVIIILFTTPIIQDPTPPLNALFF